MSAGPIINRKSSDESANSRFGDQSLAARLAGGRETVSMGKKSSANKKVPTRPALAGIIFFIVSFAAMYFAFTVMTTTAMYQGSFESNDGTGSSSRLGRGPNNLSTKAAVGREIAAGSLALIELRYPNGVFCDLDFSAYKKNPSLFPMAKDLIMRSKCRGVRRLQYGLSEAAKLARDYDEKNGLAANGVPAGFVFHESRCGSTLAANALAVIEGTRVFSESAPIPHALKEFPSNSPSSGTGDELVKDIIYLMSRFSPTYFKFQSIIDQTRLLSLFPSVPWIFIYRDPVQVMVSHLGKDPSLRKGLPPKGNAGCARPSIRLNPTSELLSLVREKLGKSSLRRGVSSLSEENICAAHLATLCSAALRNAKSSGTGMLVNYDNIMETLVDDVIPHHFGVNLSERDRERLAEVGSVYSKARAPGNAWVNDGEQKERSSTKEIVKAADTFLSDVYQELKDVSEERKGILRDA